MSRRTKVEKYGSIALAAACVLLAFRLISEFDGGSTETVHAEDRPAQAATPSTAAKQQHGKSIGKLASADPDLEIQTLKEYTSRPLPSNTRNPFDFGAAPVARSLRGGRGAAAGGPGAGGAAPPPPPPQIALRAIGYSFRAGEGGEAYLADGDQVYVVHKGNLLSKRYKILQITSSVVAVHDQSTGETVQLPIPQVQ